jgi:phosphoadenosine phosphosulfate reductase
VTATTSSVERAGWDGAALERLAVRAGTDLEDASAQEIVRWAVETFGGRLCVTSSMADAVMVDLVAKAAPGIDVLFLDTGYHFAETLGTRDAVSAVYPVNLISITPVSTVAEQDAEHGPRLHERSPDLCCALRKVAPLDRALRDYDGWITGLRRDEAPTRAATPVVAWDARRRKVKVNPIARWTEADVDRYIAENGVLVNPLLQDGYTSVGCAPCTGRTGTGENGRSGRWAGLTKTECGIHA